MSLHQLVGHGDIRAALARANMRSSLPSALLIHGPRGVGKQRLALWIAQLVMCEHPTDEGPCSACTACRMTLAVEHPDLHWYFPVPRPKGAGQRLVDALEEARGQGLLERRNTPLRPSYTEELRGLYLGTVQNIRRRAHLRPTMAEGQVFVIGDAELLIPQESSPEAANALLKLLEEPPGAARFILTSSESGRLLPTIRSRTIPLHLSSLPTGQVATFLQEHRGAAADVATWAAKLSQGSIGRALAFLPDGDEMGQLEALRRKAFSLVSAALAEGPTGGYTAALAFPASGARGLVDLFAFMEEWLRDLGAVAAGAGQSVFNEDARPKLDEIVSRTGLRAPDIALAMSQVEEARQLALGNVNPQLIVSGLVRRLRKTLVPKRMGGVRT